MFASLKVRSYWTEVYHIFTQCSQITADDLVKSILLYSAPFRNAKATNKGELADFAHF